MLNDTCTHKYSKYAILKEILDTQTKLRIDNFRRMHLNTFDYYTTYGSEACTQNRIS